MNFLRLTSAVFIAMAAASAWAHVTVAPTEAQPGAFQRYTFTVPGEKPVATIRLEVQFPEGIKVREIEAVPGWRSTVRRNAGGDLTSVLWEGGAIPGGQFARFGVIARNPDAPAELAWKAIQTYEDGSEAQWVGPRGAQFPAPVTSIRSASGDAVARAVPWAALVLALVALIVACLAWRRAIRS